MCVVLMAVSKVLWWENQLRYDHFCLRNQRISHWRSLITTHHLSLC